MSIRMIQIDIFISNMQPYVHKQKHYFYAHITIYISIKVNIIHIFHMNIHSHHHIFRRRFVYIHTFFHRKIMCGCQLETCLYDIRQTNCQAQITSQPCRAVCADLSHVYIYHRQDIPMGDSSHHACPEPSCLFTQRRRVYIQKYITRGKSAQLNPHTHEKNSCRFFRAELLYIPYIAGKNVKIVRSHTHENFLPRFLLHLDEVSERQLLKLACTNQIL